MRFMSSISVHVDHLYILPKYLDRLLVDAVKKRNGGKLPEIPHALRCQAKLAVALGLDTVDPVLITAAYDQLEEDVKAKLLVVEENKNQLKQKEAELQALQEKHAALKGFTKKYDETKEQRDREARMTESNLLILRQKKIEYEQRIREASNWLGSHVTVDHVDALFDQFQDLQKQRTELKSRLDAFNGLPADRTLAHIKVAEAEHELQILIDQRNRLLKSRGH